MYSVSLLKKFAGPLMKVTIPLAKNILAPLAVTATASAIDAGIQKKQKKKNKTWFMDNYFNIFNEETNDIMKIVQALEDSNILLKRITKKTKNEKKEQKEGFLEMLLGTLGDSLLGNMLAGKGIVRAGFGNEIDS